MVEVDAGVMELGVPDVVEDVGRCPVGSGGAPRVFVSLVPCKSWDGLSAQEGSKQVVHIDPGYQA